MPKMTVPQVINSPKLWNIERRELPIHGEYIEGAIMKTREVIGTRVEYRLGMWTDVAQINWFAGSTLLEAVRNYNKSKHL